MSGKKIDETNGAIFALRFIIGGFLGGVVGMVLIILPWALPFIRFWTRFSIIVAIIIMMAAGFSSAVFGDRFITQFMRVFKILRWFP